MREIKYIFKKKKYSPQELATIIPIRKKLTKRELRKIHSRKNLEYYYKHKDAWIKRVREYEKRNPEKVKKWDKKTFDKWYATKRGKDYIKNYNLKYYYAHKQNHLSCVLTYKVINGLNSYQKVTPKKECKICKCRNDLQIHHEVYPLHKEEVIKAIKKGKIYFLCKKHHKELHPKTVPT